VSDPRKLLGDAIRKRRVDLGLTQETLAEKAGLHWTYISGIERGTRNVSIVKLYMIARALNSSVHQLTSDF
jgi:transcriptional regulator with XRE-family HTH domain